MKRKKRTAKPVTKRERYARRRHLAHSIDLSWESLRSHLAAAVECNKQDGANEEFHARAVRDYAFILQSLSVELHELAKIDFKETFTAGIRNV